MAGWGKIDYLAACDQRGRDGNPPKLNINVLLMHGTGFLKMRKPNDRAVISKSWSYYVLHKRKNKEVTSGYRKALLARASMEGGGGGEKVVANILNFTI